MDMKEEILNVAQNTYFNIQNSLFNIQYSIGFS